MVNLVVISGGTATNSIRDVFQKLATNQNRNGTITYILPISDNGGSTSEIIRVLGGCSVGDIRSRITRLIPDQTAGMRNLLSFRLDEDPKIALDEWSKIVDGSHPLWNDVDSPCKGIIRSYLIEVHTEILRRARSSGNNFHFELASVGNLFLTGARLTFGSLESAIELILRVAHVPTNVRVLPCINTNFTYHISALLNDGTIITGQSQISHPSPAEKSPVGYLENPSAASFNTDMVLKPHSDRTTSMHSLTPEEDSDDDFVPSYVHPDLRKSQLHVNKDDTVPLPAPIDRIFYVSPYGEEIYPVARARVTTPLRDANIVVYSIGSLMTSIVPVLILQGIGNAVLQHNKAKVLLVNGSWDRETAGMTALDCIETIHKALEYSMLFEKQKTVHDVSLSSFVSHIIYLEHSEVPVDVAQIEAHGIQCLSVKPSAGGRTYNLEDLYEKLCYIADSYK